MSVIDAYNTAWENGDVETLEKLIHDDCVFNPHAPTSENNRILFENDEVGVAHSIVHFANGSDSEAVMSFMKFQNGQIISMETGATPLSPDYKLIGN
jgi:hypothetical protein